MKNPLIIRLCLSLWLLGLAIAQPAFAIPPETRDSVVSVLPEWPNQPELAQQGRANLAPEGSGIVIGSGIIATAWHVIEPAKRVEVRLKDGRIIPAQIIGQDSATDIALLSVNEPLRPFEIATESRISEPVCALGNAFGLGISVSCGVISALNLSDAGFNPIEDFVQTDAALNPGSSGGALVNQRGQLVGLVSAIFASNGDTNTGVGFAVSAELLGRVSAELLARKAVEYPHTGWNLVDATRSQLSRIAAPRVMTVTANSAADRARIQPNDLIIKIGDRRTKTVKDSIAALAVLPPTHEFVELVIERDGDRLSLSMPILFDEPSPDPVAASANDGCAYSVDICRVRQAVFPISSYDPLGSATRIGPDLLITNRHILGDRENALVFTPDGTKQAQRLDSAYQGDLVLLQVKGLPEDGYIPSLRDDGLDSERYFAIGADIAKQEIRVFQPGRLILPPAPEAPLGRIQTEALMQPGVSGGAVVDDQGDLVGIAVGGGDGHFEAIPASNIKLLLNQKTSGQSLYVTQSLGRHFVECDLALDRLPENLERNSKRVLENCSQAMNQGQLLKAGRLLARQNQLDQAIQLHHQAVNQTPNSINSRISLLVSLQLASRFTEMTEHAKWLMETLPTNAQALRFAIQAGVWGNQPALAETAYLALTKTDPKQAEAARRFIDNAPPTPPSRKSPD